MTCSEDGCTLPVRCKGMCLRHYGRARHRAIYVPVMATCPMCGPYSPGFGGVHDECPTCRMTPGEHAYRARILADSTAVYAEEAAAYRAARLVRSA